MTEERTTGRRITGNGFSGLLDRAISVVNPQAGLRRAAARNALRFRPARCFMGSRAMVSPFIR